MPERIVDVHAHIYPQRYLEFIRDIVHNDSTPWGRHAAFLLDNRISKNRAMWDIDAHFEVMDRAGVQVQALSLPIPQAYFEKESDAVEAAHLAAEEARRHAQQFARDAEQQARQAEQQARQAEAGVSRAEELHEEEETVRMTTAATGRVNANGDLQEHTKSELMQLASTIGIEGRTKMAKDELITAIQASRASRSGG